MKDFRYSFLTTIPSLRLGLNNPRNINRGASVKLASSLRLLRSFLPSLVSFFVSLSMASGDTDSFSDKVEEKFHDHNSDSDSYSDSDDDHNKRPPPKTTGSTNVYRLFGRDQPVHKVLGGGKRNSIANVSAFVMFLCVSRYYLLAFLTRTIENSGVERRLWSKTGIRN